MAKRIPKPFKYRDGWRAQVTLKNGKRPFADYASCDEAKKWIIDTLGNADTEHQPELGGPTQATLAGALNLYASLYSIAKGGVSAELNRINHYLAAQDIPLLRAVENDQGQVTLETYTPKAQPAGWQDHNDARRELRKGTYEVIAKLATKRCSTITTADIRRLMAVMKSEGLSDSTIQKEIALLRHLFNVVAKEWNWAGFENPAGDIKLGKSDMRFVFLTKEQEAALWKAIGECDNPYFWPIVIAALETTGRKKSLRAIRWELTDLEGRRAQVPSKTGTITIPLSETIVDVIKNMERKTSGPVFPMTNYAIDMAWRGVRTKAGLPKLQFRDLRHLGATEYARRGIGAHALQQILGHKSIRMAEVYVNLSGRDVLDAMDRTAPATPVFQLPPPMQKPADEVVRERRAWRVVKAVKQRLNQDVGDACQPASTAECGHAVNPLQPAPESAKATVDALPDKDPDLTPQVKGIDSNAPADNPGESGVRPKAVSPDAPASNCAHDEALEPPLSTTSNVFQFRPRQRMNP